MRRKSIDYSPTMLILLVGLVTFATVTGERIGGYGAVPSGYRTGHSGYGGPRAYGGHPAYVATYIGKLSRNVVDWNPCLHMKMMQQTH